jgi:hypothetical protein
VVDSKTNTTMHGFDERNEDLIVMLVMAYAELAAKKTGDGEEGCFSE